MMNAHEISSASTSALISENRSVKRSKPYYQVYDLENPRPQVPLPARHESKRWHRFVWGTRYLLIFAAIGVALAMPIYLLREDLDKSWDVDYVLENMYDPKVQEELTRNLIAYLCVWLLVTWLAAFTVDAFMLFFPYLFKFVASFINPSHQRYWQIFRVLRMPVTLLGCVIASYNSFQYYINFNTKLYINITKDPTVWGWDDTIRDVLEQCIYWTIGYLLEKCIILYITVHYHYRSNQVKNTHSKDMHNALVKLYEASIHLHSVGSRCFVDEDRVIRNASGSDSESKIRAGASNFLKKIGMGGRKLVQFFGNFAQSNSTHWLQANSSYSVVERCLAHPKPAAALAKRIWMTFVVRGNGAFSAEDVAEVLGPYRKEEAISIFKVIDENESGDIRLDEMVWTVVEAGRMRHDIYQNMHDINHCINTFDWILLIVIDIGMIYFILLAYVDTIKAIKDQLSIIVLGMSFAVGRVVYKFFAGCVFLFFEHPFDVGERVNIYNTAGANPVACVVTRLSTLYTVFQRIDNNTELQITNERLALDRIENLSRSGLNKQTFTVCVDFKTSFTDMMFLRQELEQFLSDNRRDYEPAMELSVVGVHELAKLELEVNFTHKSNWSNERLRAARSSKFMCALLVAVRKIPIYKPGAYGPGVGDSAKPMYTVQITDDEAAKKTAEDKEKRANARIDATKAEEQAENDSKESQRTKEEEAAMKKANEIALMQLTTIPAVETQQGRAEAASTQIDTLIQNISTGIRARTAINPANFFY